MPCQPNGDIDYHGMDDICGELVVRMGADLTPTKARAHRIAVNLHGKPPSPQTSMVTNLDLCHWCEATKAGHQKDVQIDEPLDANLTLRSILHPRAIQPELGSSVVEPLVSHGPCLTSETAAQTEDANSSLAIGGSAFLAGRDEAVGTVERAAHSKDADVDESVYIPEAVKKRKKAQEERDTMLRALSRDPTAWHVLRNVHGAASGNKTADAEFEEAVRGRR